MFRDYNFGGKKFKSYHKVGFIVSYWLIHVYRKVPFYKDNKYQYFFEDSETKELMKRKWTAIFELLWFFYNHPLR